ncbi:hypothetical protein NLM33_35850 [Bradyrhizobium sp. CCGUVB1N3]|uniref:hypothetical protein n=1 Tax=Bradyrhizobium sp. CCGUVB1N3 TaxID=2949629 RepID=UPI0020B4348F|nr:hypothetical protein [Bradyrhizobium sp. CCGUVB1N3]MCP3475650.1 hypothetical protein [Bradyrhizobium sp. CCGUVB1N3]
MSKEREGEKGAMKGGGRHEFFVVNLTNEKLKGHVLWRSGGNEIKLDVNGWQGFAAKAVFPVQR